MDIELTGKNAIVCGSTQGIGNAIAQELAQLGARLTLIARNEDKLKQCVEDLPTPQSQNHDFLTADFQEPHTLADKVDQFTDDRVIHILINNTGGPPGGPITEAKLDEFDNALAMHLKCNHLLVQNVLPGMQKADYGRIINVISTSVKQPIKGLGVSNTTRGAVANWAKTLSLEIGHEAITVNNILPGYTKTQRLSNIIKKKAKKGNISEEKVQDNMFAKIPMNRFGAPAEVARVAAFLTTPAASYVNGVSLPVDGGRTGSL